MLEGYVAKEAAPRLDRADSELLVASALLHDSGYIKRGYDTTGTGAKYTLIHERLSSTFAWSYLTSLGVPRPAIHDLSIAIGCTGPVNRMAHANFTRPEARVIAAILVTADYLGQMAARDYLEKLPILYREFEQAYEYAHVPPEARPFKGVADLMRKTPGFWRNFVQPMLEADLDGVYRCIAAHEDGSNPYISAVEHNIAQVSRLTAAPAPDRI
jgi:hypothetical protein